MLSLLFQAGIVIVAIVLVSQAQKLRTSMAYPFPRTRASILPEPVECPTGTEDLYQEAENLLLDLGFEESFWVKLDHFGFKLSNHEIARIHMNKKKRIAVVLEPPLSLDAPNRLTVQFWTKLIDGRWAVTTVNDPFFQVIGDSKFVGQTILLSDFATMIEKHEAHVRGVSVPADTRTTHADTILDLVGEQHNELVDRMVSRGWLKKHGDVAYPTLGFAIRMQRWVATRIHKETEVQKPVPFQRLLHFSKMVENIRMWEPPSSVQLYLFAWTSIAFVLVGSVLFSSSFAISLLVIIIFHEFGHWFAMRAFGYKNVHITVLPLLGGVTMGQEMKPDRAKRAWMSLAGPVPGIIVGAAGISAIYSGVEWAQAEWFSALMFWMLIVNYLNLLPIPPLDGSHAAAALFPTRWVTFRIGALCLGVGVALFFSIAYDFWIIGILALLQLILVGRMLSMRTVLKDLQLILIGKGRKTQVRLDEILRAADEALGPAKNVLKRVLLAKDVQYELNEPPLGHAQRSLIAIVFFGLLIAPGFLVVQATASIYATSNVSSAYVEAEKTSLDLDLVTLVSDLSEEQPIPGPANTQAIASAEDRLGVPLPADLQRLYRVADGVPAIGLVPVDSVMRLRDFTDANEKVEAFAYEGRIQLFLENGLTPDVSPQTVWSWWYLGKGSSDDELLLWIPVSGDKFGGYQLVHLSDGSGSGYRNITSWIRQSWISMRQIAEHERERKAKREIASEKLANASIEILIEQFPRPALWFRLMGVEQPWPNGAHDDTLQMIEEKLGRSLPVDHRKALSKHNGFPPVDLLPAEDIQKFSELSPETMEQLDFVFTIEFTANSAGKNIKLQISPSMLSTCWIVGGHKFRYKHKQPIHADSVYPKLLWCPDARLPGNYLVLEHHQLHDSLTDVLREMAIAVLSTPGY